MLGHGKTRTRPVLTVVLCSEPRSFQRAAAWARTLSNDAAGPVHVCKDLGFLQTYLAPEGQAVGLLQMSLESVHGTPEGQAAAPPSSHGQSQEEPWHVPMQAPRPDCLTFPPKTPLEPNEPVKLFLAPRRAVPSLAPLGLGLGDGARAGTTSPSGPGGLALHGLTLCP